MSIDALAKYAATCYAHERRIQQIHDQILDAAGPEAALWAFVLDEPMPLGVTHVELQPVFIAESRLEVCSENCAFLHGHDDPADILDSRWHDLIAKCAYNYSAMRMLARLGYAGCSHVEMMHWFRNPSEKVTARPVISDVLGCVEKGHLLSVWGVSTAPDLSLLHVRPKGGVYGKS